jgi:outer membrane protein TolC
MGGNTMINIDKFYKRIQGASAWSFGWVRNYSLPSKGLCVAVILVSLAVLSSCQTNLAQIRDDNASMVISKYRVRTLAEANHGRTDLTLHDCVRLALDNSLEIQTALWDEYTKGKLAQSSSLRSLPTIKGFYNQSQRDLLPWSRSDVIEEEGEWEVQDPGGTAGVTNFSTGRERIARFWNAQLAWSPMDAAMARFLAEIKCNETVQAGYQRSRVAQQIVGTVTSAFYRLLALRDASGRADSLLSNRNSIERDLEKLASSSLVDRHELLTAKTLTAEARNQVAEIRLNIDRQTELLASAMNVCPSSLFTIDGPLMPLPAVELDCGKLEATALRNRPEAYQADLTFINSLADHKRLLVKYFPRVEGFFGYFRDENHFLLNKNWVDGGITATWDLLDFTTNFLERDAAQNKIAKTDRERAAISMGILTQVKLKSLEVVRAMEKFSKTSTVLFQAKEALRISTATEEVREKKAAAQVIRIARQKDQCNLLQAEIDRLMAVGECHSAISELDTAVGTNYPVSMSLNPLTVENSQPPGPPEKTSIANRFAGLLSRMSPF